MASNPVTKVTEEQYLAIDRAAEFRSEFLDGEMIAMSGGSMRHAQLQANVIGELFAQFHRGCPFASCENEKTRKAAGMPSGSEVVMAS